MSFFDQYLPPKFVGYEWVTSPRTSTTITAAWNQSEQRNRNTVHPLRHFSGPGVINCYDDVQDIVDHWYVVGGPLDTFPMRDPMDFASRRLVMPNLAVTPLGTDQVLGIGDGFNRVFQLQKKYTRGVRSYVRPIHIPIVDTVIVMIDAKALSTADPALPGGPYTITVSRYGGSIVFDHAPGAGAVVTAGFLFDNEVRFEADDQMDVVLKAFQTAGTADLSFVEVRFCNDGMTT